MDKRLQLEYEKLNRNAIINLMDATGNVLPKDIARLILSYVSQYERYTFSRLNIRVRYWRHINVALCYTRNVIYTQPFEEIDELFVRENTIHKKYYDYHIYRDSIAAHSRFRKNIFDWHGIRLNNP